MARKTEGGQGGKKGHSNMSHWEGTEEIKQDRKKRRRRDGKKMEKDAKAGLHESQIKTFNKFLESLKDDSNITLVESIKKGFQTCFDSE